MPWARELASHLLVSVPPEAQPTLWTRSSGPTLRSQAVSVSGERLLGCSI